MITPSSQAAEYTKNKLESRRKAIKALAKDYFNKNIKQIEARFNKALVENSYASDYGVDVGYQKRPTTYSFCFSWPYEWYGISYELKAALYDLLAEHVRKYGYNMSSVGVSDARIFEYQNEGCNE